ncbi:MobF family relaxase [Pseudomonas carnis]|uniref:MobF family relaxase n=1 Tax=Pseudomonas carnis TaxID=2487355 RepID=UPI001D945518|nr:MobF family relaxase [Pseudomonas carnis]CAH0273998.1 Multifunctional conjugation protein TraI [Pseudomonas carnis]CAH0323674.1 Multifunctional conjugation protein TraI [Pseudomonas carnis]CAH0324680.1 Multifunctional conjugation protein TraI [Pseudomonas carnis]CAH0325791.1 Multifunctional conjugation protein TraI [Pseudomonas carnis]
MLNVTPIRGNNQYAAARYFSAADDYYAKETPGEWQGEGAERLGLVGPVDQAQLAKLLDGKLPNGEKIHTTFNAETNKRRMGLDMTFSAPKSVSMQALVAGDKNVTLAHDRAVAKAMHHVEKLAQARRKEQGKFLRERTGNMVIGKFRHEMSRGKDPQLHTHAVIMNMTQRADGKWRALFNDDIFKVQHEVDAMYKGQLALELRELGYEIRVLDGKGNFELNHISREQIEAFSSRSKVIEEALAKDGKTRADATTLEKQVISMATRPHKDERDRDLVKQYWVTKSRDLGIDYGPQSRLDGREYGESGPASGAGRVSSDPNLPAGLTPAQAVVQYAINHLTEREQVVSQLDLLTVALQRSVGLAGPDQVRAEIARLVHQGTLIESAPAYSMAQPTENAPVLSPAGWQAHLQELKGWTDKQAKQYVATAIERGSLVPTEKRYTTQKGLKREKAILAIERTGRGQVTPLMTQEQVAKALEGSTLTAGQRQAVEAIVSTDNRFVGIQGDAGTGKTYSVERAVQLLTSVNEAMSYGKTEDQPGYRILALAPYGNQVAALKNEGMDAHTLASFFNTKDKTLDERTIIVLDEAGVVGARQMEQLMRLVEKSGARLVQLGDTKQTEAIEAGKPFAQLQQNGMQTARIKEIQRQKDPELKLAVEHAADGNTPKSLQHIKHIEELRNPSDRHQAIVNDYMQLTPQERREVLIVAGTNKDRKEINTLARKALGLEGRGSKFDTLNRVDMTQAERRYAPTYQQGMVIQPEKDYKKAGLVRGENYTVKQALPGNILVVTGADGQSRQINPRQVTKLSVYKAERPELSIGDLVRITRNTPSLDLTNGDRMRVVSTANGLIELASTKERDGKPERVVKLPANKPLHLEHAYSATVHSAQGLTNDRVMISVNTKSRTTSLNLFYVAISRARLEARIYTDAIAGLPGAIAKRYDKTTALTLQQERDAQRLQKSHAPKTVADGPKTERALEREKQARPNSPSGGMERTK